MKLYPVYEQPADSQLDALETGPDADLWGAIVGVIEMICEDTDDGTGRSHRLSGSNGRAMWAVRVPYLDPDDYYVLWADGAGVSGERSEAVFYYVGQLPQGTIAS